MTSWRTLSKLTWRDRWLLAQALLLLPLAAAAIRMVGFQRLRAALLRLAPRPLVVSSVHAEPDLKTARRCAAIVGMAARRGPMGGNCLQHSLVLWWLLTRRSIPAEVRLGVRTVSGRLQAHAWVEVEGQIIADRADIRQLYTAFDRALLSSQQC